ncbi:hypothetical protein C802_00768 [Phocaeicola sartorii]|uniref:Uncharacterized protein n=1 Tax=Phocaeicola sartorii TaxID=671267 RepID=R9IB85_9BACT|nr:hypothetical protein C802_00768 [Phocaeicola sartorii]
MVNTSLVLSIGAFSTLNVSFLMSNLRFMEIEKHQVKLCLIR